ncbi:hypothetical protein [Novipirellula caenicola]|uniref:Zinc-finger domain-containing protein n=1 Tax=Novipirellula caenicola TaxID=1536901 RepID=A0ABP9VU04_9BACT
MLSCKEITKLVSVSMDQPLSLRQRIELWIHLRMCRICAGFRRDIVYLHEQTRRHQPDLSHDVSGKRVKLSTEASLRIKQAIRSRTNNQL